jgi:hypothetical protein
MLVNGRPYITVSELQIYAWQHDDEDLIAMGPLVVRASRIFDILTYVPAEFFLPLDEPHFSKTFYGDGTVFLALPSARTGPLVVTMPEGNTVPPYVLIDRCLRTVDDNGLVYSPGQMGATVWPRGLPIMVESDWGFPAVPEDVKEAVAELVIAMWRSKDLAFLKAVNLETNATIVKEWPDRTKQVAAFYESRKNVLPVFL